MHSTLDAFLEDIQELRMFVDSSSDVYNALSRHEEAGVRDCVNIRRRLDYAAFIIAMYGVLEKFVDDLAWSHTELESSRNKYSELSQKLRQKHLSQSAYLLGRGRLGEGRYRDVSEIDIIKNLYDCLTGETPYKLNRHAVVHHDYNLRSDIIRKVFASLGIHNIHGLACRVETMIDWFSAAEGLESSSTKEVPQKIVDLKLDDLVGRRNQLAHGARDTYESLDVNEMRARLAFLEAYGRSLFRVIAGDYLERYYIRSGEAISLGSPIGSPLKRGEVVVVRKPPRRIFRGQAIIAVRRNRVDRWGEILELQVTDVPVDSVELDSATAEIGLRADFKFTKGIELYALEAKDEAVWG